VYRRETAGVLFLYRPRQTWMPYSLPRNRTDQAQYNRRMQDKFDATRRVAAPDAPAPAVADAPDTVGQLKQLAELHASGALSDEEFATAKAKVLGGSAGS
jgi:hypothetical protein